MKVADLYIRVSTDEQADKGYSQRDQEERLKRYCEVNSIQVRHIIFEDYSAKTFNRPAWKKFLLDLKSRKTHPHFVLFTKWDRFSRNTGDAYQMINTLRKFGVDPQAIEQPLDMTIPESKMMLAVYLAAPEVENDRRALNVFHGMRRAKKEGRWMATAPKGYVNKTTEDGKKYITPKEPEATILKWVFEEISQAQLAIDQIRQEANRKGLKIGRAQFWDLIHNPIYCGKIYIPPYRNEEGSFAQGLHDPIISERLFFEVQNLINGRKRKSGFTKIKARDSFPLRGYLLCPDCHRSLTASTSSGRSKKYSYYHRLTPCKCRFHADTTNEKFHQHLTSFVPCGDFTDLLELAIAQSYQLQHAQRFASRKATLTQLDAVNLRLRHARELLADQKIEPDDFRELKADCQQKIELLEAQLESNPVTHNNSSTLLKKAIKTLTQIDSLYQNGTVEEKRQIIGSIFPEKLVFDGNSFRTARLNEVVRLIFKLGTGFSETKNRTTLKNFELSGEEVPSRFELLYELLQSSA